MAGERGKVTVTLDVKLTVEVTDDGYLGLDATVQRHIHKAKTDAQGWKFLVQRGATQPKEVRAQVKVLAVSIVPEVQA